MVDNPARVIYNKHENRPCAAAEQDNPLPITSAAVHAQLGQVNALLASI